MSAYEQDQERRIRVGRLVDDWTTSGLLSAGQRDTILPDLQVDLRRTNLFLRLTLFVFSLMIILSTFGLVVMAFDFRGETAGAVLCTMTAIACYWLAAFLVDKYRLYRFGVEEAAAVVAVGMTGAGAGLFMNTAVPGSNDWPIAIGLAAAGLVVFLRFGYLYAALASMVCVGLVPFQFGDSETIQRIAAAGLLAAIAASVRFKRAEYGDDYPGDTYALLEAAAWLGIYAVVNLQLTSGFRRVDAASWFYWLTYAGIWIVPAMGLWLAIRSRVRPLLDVSLLMVLATLMSNKLYLGAERYAWDPMVFGLLLMGTAIGVRRWLAGGVAGGRYGFTASRMLASDKAKVGVIGIASAAHPGGPAAHTESAPAEPIDGGGRSGGAGASGSF